MPLRDFDTLPTLEESLNSLSETKRSAAWVYCPDEDDTTTSLYPMGFELQNEYFESTSRKPPVRRASFAVQRYAKVHQRPQRAHSFAQQRDLNIRRVLQGSHRGPLAVNMPKLPRPKLIMSNGGHYAKPNKIVSRSNSMQVTKAEKANNFDTTLSNKFQACSLDELDSSSVLEIGSLASGKSSEPSLVDALTDIPSKSINSMQTERFGMLGAANKFTDDEDYHKYRSFSSPTLNSMETVENYSSSESTPNMQRYTTPEVDYTKPESIRSFHSLGRINQNYYFKYTSFPNESINDSAGKDTGAIHERKNTYSNSKNSRKGDLLAPYTFIPRISPVKSQHISSSTYDSDNCRQEEAAHKDALATTCHAGRIGTFDTFPMTKYSLTRHLENRHTHFESSPLPVIEETDRLSNEEYAIVHKPTKPSYYELDERSRQHFRTSANATKSNNTLALHDIVKPPRHSIMQKNLTSEENSANKEDIKNRTEINTLLSTTNGEVSHKDETSDENSFRSEVENKNVEENSNKMKQCIDSRNEECYNETDMSLHTLPEGEMKSNIIVLRVPSFRTAGCQTESYKPVRRRASCAQTNLSVAPRNREQQAQQRSVESESTNWRKTEPQASPGSSEQSSSSSGYSSPEVSSKDQSPGHSGPPSPSAQNTGSNPEACMPQSVDGHSFGKPNITVIEINKSENTTLISTLAAPLPPRPPKPIRLRLSAAADLMRNEWMPVQRKQAYNNSRRDAHGLPILREGADMNRPVSPILVHAVNRHPIESLSSKPVTLYKSNSIASVPRIVEMRPKRLEMDHEVAESRAEVFAEDGRTSVLPRLRNSFGSTLNAGALTSLLQHEFRGAEETINSRWPDGFDWVTGQKWREEREKELANKWAHDTDGRATAAYLASLELLASHYRHQALVNARKLEKQKELLEQRFHPKQRYALRGFDSDTEESTGVEYQRINDTSFTASDQEEQERNSFEENEENIKKVGQLRYSELSYPVQDERGVWHT